MKTSHLSERLLEQGFIILDLETTGLLEQDPDTRIVQVTLLNQEGRILFSTLVNPLKPIPEDATKIHGIKDSDVAMAPTLEEIFPFLRAFLEDQTILVYHAGFDITLLNQRIRTLGLGGKLSFKAVHCVMEMYQHWSGERKSLPLPNLSGGKKHDTHTDCINTLLLVKKMAGRTPEILDLDF